MKRINMNKTKIFTKPEAAIPRESIKLPVNVVPDVTPNPDRRVGILVSRLSHATEISYNGSAFKLAPRGRTKRDIEYERLGAIPSGIKFIG